MEPGFGDSQPSGGGPQANPGSRQGCPAGGCGGAGHRRPMRQTSREAWSLKHMGDRTNLDLVGRQQELVTAMLATGKPVIVFLFNGSPLSIQYLHENVPVIFECWYLGQECGHAVADVLFGDFNPGGKLPMTIPRSAGHLPAFYNYKPSARRGYCSTTFPRSIPSVLA